MEKLQRNYKLILIIPEGDGIQKGGETLTIQYPLTCEFEITRDVYAQSNKANFKIYNLSLNTRNKIFQDKFNIARWVFAEFYAGYGDVMPLIFKGKILQAYSVKNNNDIITEIQCLDSGIYGYTSKTFEPGTPKIDILKTVMKDLPATTIGAIGATEGSIQSHLTLEGQTIDILIGLTGGDFFIDNGVANKLNNNEVLDDSGVYKLTSASGLLGTPKRADAKIEVEVIFAPEITVGQIVEIESTTAGAQFNGQYKVTGLSHHGVISGAVSGSVTTSLTMLVGARLPNSNGIWTGISTVEPISKVVGDKVIPITIKEMQTIRSVYNYLITHNAPPNWNITKNIKWTEALLNYSLQYQTPSIEVLTNLYVTAEQLQNFKNTFYPGASLIITSGWRSVTRNRVIGGATNSQHIYGRAYDFQIPGANNAQVYKNFKNFWQGWSKSYPTWIHGDTRGVKHKIANDK